MLSPESQHRRAYNQQEHDLWRRNGLLDSSSTGENQYYTEGAEIGRNRAESQISESGRHRRLSSGGSDSPEHLRRRRRKSCEEYTGDGGEHLAFIKAGLIIYHTVDSPLNYVIILVTSSTLSPPSFIPNAWTS